MHRPAQPGLFKAGAVLAPVTHSITIPLEGLSAEAIKALRKMYTYDNPKFAQLERLGKWTGSTPRRLGAGDTYDETSECLILPRGRPEDIRKCLADHGVTIHYDDRRVAHRPVRFGLLPKRDPITMRPDQERLIEAALAHETCLLRAAPGSGKTEVAIELIARLRQPALVIVWSSGLFEQWIRRLCKRWGWAPDQVGVIGKGKFKLRPVTIAMQQALKNRITQVADQWGLVIADEVQRFAAPTFREAIGLLPARYRIGMSADEKRKDRMHMLIYDHFGKPAAEVKRHELIGRGDLCEVEIRAVPTDVRCARIEEAPPAERGAIVGQMWGELLDMFAQEEGRNDLIAALAAREVAERRAAGQCTIVFTDRVEHARDLARRIAVHYGTPCGLCLGGPAHKAAFEETCARLDSGDLRCAVATSCMYQGQDIPRLTVGIVATPTASNKQLLEQQVGRLRRTYEGKERGVLYYVLDQHIFPGHIQNLRRWYGQRLVRWVDDGWLAQCWGSGN